MLTIPICITVSFLGIFFAHKYFRGNSSSYNYHSALVYSCVIGCIVGFLVSFVVREALLEHSIDKGNVNIVVSNGFLDPFPHEDGKSVFIIKRIENGTEYMAFIINGKEEECATQGSFFTSIVVKKQKVGLLNTHKEQVITAKGWVKWFANKKTIRIFTVHESGIRKGWKRKITDYVLYS